MINYPSRFRGKVIEFLIQKVLGFKGGHRKTVADVQGVSALMTGFYTKICEHTNVRFTTKALHWQVLHVMYLFFNRFVIHCKFVVFHFQSMLYYKFLCHLFYRQKILYQLMTQYKNYLVDLVLNLMYSRF